MAATTPEQIHRLFEATFNAGDLDGSWRYVIDNAWGDQAVAG
jgi:hypothetical protein